MTSIPRRRFSTRNPIASPSYTGVVESSPVSALNSDRDRIPSVSLTKFQPEIPGAQPRNTLTPEAPNWIVRTGTL